MPKKSAELYIDGYIGANTGSGGIFGDIQSFGLKELNDFINRLDADVSHINVHINSGGGSVDEGFAIYDKLVASPYQITTIGEGMVGSIATVVYLAGDTRKIFKNSRFFIHNPRLPFAEDIQQKDAQQLADQLKIEEDRVVNFYVEKTGKSADILKPFMDKETSFTSQEAVDMGFVTEIIGKESQNKKEYKLVAYTKNSQIKNDTMKKEDQISWFKKIENMIAGLKPQAVAYTTRTSEGVDVWFDGELKVGTKIWLDESMTKPAPDGVHTVDGFLCTVKGGAVESIQEIDNEAEALKKENALLKAEVEAQKLKVTELESAKVETDKTVNELSKEITAFKKVIIGDAPEKVITQDFSKGPKPAGRFDGIKNNLVKKYGK